MCKVCVSLSPRLSLPTSALPFSYPPCFRSARRLFSHVGRVTSGQSCACAHSIATTPSVLRSRSEPAVGGAMAIEDIQLSRGGMCKLLLEASVPKL